MACAPREACRIEPSGRGRLPTPVGPAAGRRGDQAEPHSRCSGGSETWPFPPTPAPMAAARQNPELLTQLPALPRLLGPVAYSSAELAHRHRPVTERSECTLRFPRRFWTSTDSICRHPGPEIRSSSATKPWPELGAQVSAVRRDRLAREDIQSGELRAGRSGRGDSPGLAAQIMFRIRSAQSASPVGLTMMIISRKH